MFYILLTARYRGSLFLFCQAHRSFGIPFQGEAFLSLCRLQPVAAFEAREGKISLFILGFHDFHGVKRPAAEQELMAGLPDPHRLLCRRGSVRIQNAQARNSKIYSFIIKNLPVPRLPFFDASFLIF